MKRGKTLILSARECSCKNIEIPPVKSSELAGIIRYKLSSFYPGNVEDLAIDYLANGSEAVVFYMPEKRLKEMKEQNPGVLLYTTFHLLSDIKGKEGIYLVPEGESLDIHFYEGNRLIRLYAVDNTMDNRSAREKEGAQFIDENGVSLSKSRSLFTSVKKSNFLFQILALLTLIALVPQLGLYYQYRMDRGYKTELEREVVRLTEEKARKSSSAEVYEKTAGEYEDLKTMDPLNLQEFLSDLSVALGREVSIDSLVLKNRSFQMNGSGINPLEKMERFKENRKFSSVIPYQVMTLEDSNRDKFSLTGVYGDE